MLRIPSESGGLRRFALGCLWMLFPAIAAAQELPTISTAAEARTPSRGTAAAAPTAPAAPASNTFIKTTENGQQCTTITFEGLADLAAVPPIEGINSPGWLSLIDYDAGGNGNFANEPSPQTIMFWLGGDPSIVLDKPASKVEFYYSTSVTLIVTAFDKDNHQIAQITRPPNFQGGPGDPNGDYSGWTALTVLVPGKKIKRLNVVGGPNYTGFDNLKVCNAIGVDSVELTQAIQQWQSLDDLKADLQPDREAPVPVIAGKPAALRVYMEQTPNVASVSVEVSGAVSGSKTLSIQPQCTTEKQRRNQGGCASADFFFTPPSGNFDITVKVRDSGGTITDSQDLPFTARKTNALRLKAVSICDATSAGGTWQCAPASDLTSRIETLRRIAPTNSVTVQTTSSQVRRRTSSFPTVDDWWTAAIGDVANFYGIFDSLTSFFGTTVKYYGMIRPVLPGGTGGMANNIPGNGAGSRSSVIRLGVETASEVVAHETGHTLGLRHTNNNVPAAGAAPPGCYNTAVDPATNWPFANNRIQSTARLEVGYDVVARRPLDPQNTFEIMSYCVPRWISPQRYKMLITALSGGAVASPSAVTTAEASDPVPAWLLSGTIANGAATFDPLFVFETKPGPGEGSYRAEVLDASGQLLVTRAFDPFTPEAETADAPVTGPQRFSVLVPKPTAAASIVIRSATDDIAGTLSLSGAAPTVLLVGPAPPTTLSGTALLTWTIADADSLTHTTRVHYSADDGQTWSELGVVTNNQLLVDFDALPGGAATRLRLIVSDGINSSTATFGPYSTPKKQSVTATILSPAHDVVVQPGHLFLEGVGTDVDEGTLTGSALTWSSDHAGELGSGELLDVDLATGTHRIQLKATDSDGNSDTANVTVVVAGAAPLVDLTAVALDTLPTTCVAATIAVTASGLPASLVDYSLDGGETWQTVPLSRLPFRFIVPGSGFFHVIARAFDAAGQSTADDEEFFTSATCTQQTDLTPPEVTATVTGTPGTAGWYTSAVTVNWQVEDLESGIADASGCETTLLTSDTTGVTLTCSATNGAGMTTTQSVTVRIDQTAPQISAVRAPEANANGWNNTPVTVTFACIDATSGLAAGSLSSPVDISSEGQGQSADGSCADVAGNVASMTVTNINIDMGAPTVTASASLPFLWPPNGKTVPDVISGQIVDALSGLDFATFEVRDEYGVVRPTGAIAPGRDGSYATTLMLEASRLGEDLDGRRYDVILTVQDKAGNRATTSTVIVVPHDQR